MIERLELAAAYTVITMALTVSIAVAVRGNDFTGEVDGATPPSEEQQVSVTDSPVIDTTGDAGEGEDGADSGDQAGGVDGDSGDVTGAVDGADAGGETGAVDGEDPEEGADDPGCVEALSDNAQSQEELGDHVADADTPAGGVDGNQNALDSQCGGAFAEEPPVSDGDAPAESATGPGKSEQANGGGNGNANGGGQGNADSNGNGPSGARGHLKP